MLGKESAVVLCGRTSSYIQDSAPYEQMTHAGDSDDDRWRYIVGVASTHALHCISSYTALQRRENTTNLRRSISAQNLDCTSSNAIASSRTKQLVLHEIYCSTVIR